MDSLRMVCVSARTVSAQTPLWQRHRFAELGTRSGASAQSRASFLLSVFLRDTLIPPAYARDRRQALLAPLDSRATVPRCHARHASDRGAGGVGDLAARPRPPLRRF